MSFITSLFGSKKLVEEGAEIVNKSVGILDNAFYTDQERASNRLEAQKVWLAMTELFMREGSNFAVARRLLALIVAGYYFPMCVVSAGLFVGAIFVPPEMNMRMLNTAVELKGMAVEQVWLVVSVYGFYFGPGLLERFKSGKKTK